MLLTSTNKEAVLPAGYYDAFRVSTNITSLPGTISYTYHHHSLSTANYTTSSASGGSYPDGYQSPIRGGCFTTAYYHIVYSESVPTWFPSWSGPHYHNGEAGAMQWNCSYCGEESYSEFSGHWHDVDTNYNYWTTNASDHPANRIATVYLRSCGKSEGQIATATITY